MTRQNHTWWDYRVYLFHPFIIVLTFIFASVLKLQFVFLNARYGYPIHIVCTVLYIGITLGVLFGSQKGLHKHLLNFHFVGSIFFLYFTWLYGYDMIQSRYVNQFAVTMNTVTIVALNILIVVSLYYEFRHQGENLFGDISVDSPKLQLNTSFLPFVLRYLFLALIPVMMSVYTFILFILFFYRPGGV